MISRMTPRISHNISRSFRELSPRRVPAPLGRQTTGACRIRPCVDYLHVRRYPPRMFPRTPPPEPPAVPATRPSEGWIRSHPEPEKPTWIVSPEPRPMRVFTFTSALMEDVTPLDQVIAALGSAKVCWPSSWIRSGGPSETSAIQ